MAFDVASSPWLQEKGVQLLPLLTALAAVIYVVYLRYLSPLAGVPGPFWASLSRLWVARRAIAGDTHRVMIDLHRKHGKVVRIAPNEISFSDLDAAKKVYGAATKFRKSDWYSVWQGHRKFDLFGERDERVHGAQRRLVSHAYSMSSLKDLEKYVDSAVSYFVERIKEQSGRTMDLAVWYQLFAFDVIGEVSFSKRFGYLDAGDDAGIFEKIEGTLRSGAWVGQLPWLWNLDDFLSPLIGSRLGINGRHSSVRDFAQKQITERKGRGSDHQDILGKLLETQMEKPEQMDDAAVLSMMTSNVFAGSDTTAISLRAFTYYVLRNPQCKVRLMEEFDAAKKAGRLSVPATLDQSKELPYFQACLQEALRLHPAVGLSPQRVVPPDGFEIDGHFIPGGNIVGVNPWVIHREEAIYGPEPENFRPERWMKGEGGDPDRFHFAFGAGARMCIGKNISWMEMSKLLPTLFLMFDIELTQPEIEWKTTCWWFVKQDHLRVTMKPRLND